MRQVCAWRYNRRNGHPLQDGDGYLPFPGGGRSLGRAGDRSFPEAVHIIEHLDAGVVAGGTQVVVDLALGPFQIPPGGRIGRIIQYGYSHLYLDCL